LSRYFLANDVLFLILTLIKIGFQCDSREGRVCSAAVQTVVTLTKLVSPLAMQQCLKFLYTGTIDTGKLCEIAVSKPYTFDIFS
jgi:hypothetical protein